jgi:hypothetical protein
LPVKDISTAVIKKVCAHVERCGGRVCACVFKERERERGGGKGGEM